MKRLKNSLLVVAGLLLASCATFTPVSLSSNDANTGVTVTTKDITISHGVRYASNMVSVQMYVPEKDHIFVALEASVTAKGKTSFDLNNITIKTASGAILVPALGRTAYEPNSVLSKSTKGNVVPFVRNISGTSQFVLFYLVALSDLPSEIVVFGKDSAKIGLPDSAYTTGAQMELN